MKNVLKRNQIIIWVIALMLVSAGYLSYSGNKTNVEKQTSAETIKDDTLYAGIGDAKLVNSNNVIEDNKQVAIVPNEEESGKANSTGLVQNDEKTTSSISSNEENDVNNNNNNVVTTNSNWANETKEYFSESRLNRETMYSQMLESYQKILESESISETQKAIAQTEIQNINSTKNKIMICENLIKTKGIEDLVIFVNDKSISVVVRKDKLEQEQIAQIQNIIAREMEAELENIHISNK